MNTVYSHKRTRKVPYFFTPLHRLFLALSILITLIGIPTSTVSADPVLPLLRMPICGDQAGPEPLVFSCSDFVPSKDVPIYEVPGTASRNFLFDFIFREAGYNNELGMFKVDNESGAIGGLLPGDPGYLAAAFQRQTIIFRSGSDASTPASTLPLLGGDIYVFFIIQDNSTENFLASNPTNDINQFPLAFFSLEILNPDGVDHFVGFHNTVNGFSQFGFEDLTWGGDADYDDVVYNISPPLRPEPPQPAAKPPLILVHGWQGLNYAEGGFHCSNDSIGWNDIEKYQRYSPTDSNSTLKSEGDSMALADWLSSDYQVWIAHLESTPNWTPSLEFNAVCLRDQLKYVYSQNPQPITIVAHSMGGVVSRSAIGLLGDPDKMIKSLYTLGSPHAGLPTDVLTTLKIACEIQVAACNMSVSQMLFGFNPAHPNIKDIDYFFIGGTTSPFLRGGHILYALQKNDGLVGSYSAVGWLFPSKFFVPDWAKDSQPGQYWTGETHSRFYVQDNNYYSPLPGNTYSSAFWCINALSTNQDMNNYLWACEPAGTSAQSLLASATSAQTTSTPSVSTELRIGHLDANQSVSIPLAIDTSTTSLFYLTWSGDAPVFTLTRPDNQAINPAYAVSHPNEVSYETSPGGADAPPFAAYDFTSTQPGIWQLNITGTGAIDYQTFANFDSPRTLIAQTDIDIYNIGDTATITATLQNNGIGITGTSVIATLTRPDAVVNTVPLVYLGNGIYAANYIIPNTPGYLTIAVTANGNDNGTTFSRQEHLLVAIKSNDLQLTGLYGDQPGDDNLDGLYEKLDFHIGVNLASAGAYTATAELYAGDQLITQAGDFFDLAAGVQTIMLSFDGGAIREAGLNGPYTIRNLHLTPINPGITSQSVDSAWTTVAYNYSQFGIHPCYLLTLNHTGSGMNPTASPVNSSGCAAGEYTAGEIIDLKASPNMNWNPIDWAGTLNDSTTELLNTAIMPAHNHSVIANYVLACYAINTFVSPLDTGVVWINQITDGIFDPPPICQDDNQYPYGAVIRLTANPEPGYAFNNWFGDISVTTNPVDITMLSNKSVTAHFSNGADTTGVFRPSNGLLYLKNSNTTGFADIAINYGIASDYPVVGDWDGDGTVTIGIYRNGSFYLRNSNTIGFADLVFPFGTPGDQPIAGDWNGDGIDTIGVYRPSNGQFLLRNSNSAGAEDMSFYLGNVGDVGIAGDWNGDGFDTTGVFRPSNGIIFLKNTNQTGFADIALNYGIPGDKPVIGDWDNDGIDTIGVYRNATFYLRNSNTIGFADIVFGLGNPGDMPIAGNWDGIP